MQRPAHFEAMMWLGFSIGGFASAFLLPVHILVSNVVVPLGWLGGTADAYGRMVGKLALPLTKLYLVVVLGATLHHAIHRLKFTVLELGLRPARRAVSTIFYLLEGVGLAALLAVLLL